MQVFIILIILCIPPIVLNCIEVIFGIHLDMTIKRWVAIMFLLVLSFLT